MLASCVAVASSCITDIRGGGGGDPSTRGKVTFRISVPRPSGPATRALSATGEWDVDPGDVWVLMFDAATTRYAGHFKGAVTTGPTANGTNGGATLDFEVTLPMGDPCNLMVVANAGEILAGCSAALTKDNTQSQVEKALTATMTAGGWATGHTDGEAAKLFPMWGYATGVKIDDFRADTGSGKYFFRENNPLGLVRMVAKVDVKLGTAAAGKFILQQVYVYNYNTRGRLAPDTAAAAAAGLDWTFEGIAPADRAAYLNSKQIISLPPASTQGGKAGDPASASAPIIRTVTGGALEREIYLFEASESDPPTNSTAYWNSPCLVIGGKYDGSTETTYYRVDFAVRQNDETWKYVPLKRNNSYTVVIEDITSPGATDPDDARKTIPANINAQIVEWSGPSEIKIVVTDNIYMLGVSHDSFTFMKDAQTAASSYNKFTVVTDHYDGWTARVKNSADPADTTPVDWLSLGTAGTKTTGEPSPNRYTTGGTEIDLIATENGGTQRTAWIHVAAGRMTYKVKVTQTSTAPFLRVVDAASGEPLETITYPTVGATGRSFRVEWYPGDTPVEVIHTPRDYAELTWDAPSSTARRIVDDGGGGYTYADIVPNNSSSDPLSRFRRYGRNMTFVLPTTSGALMASIYLNQGTTYGVLTMSLADIADPPATTHTGATVDPSASATFTVTSTIGGTPQGSSTPEYHGAPWVVDFMVDGVWKSHDQITSSDGVWVTLSRYSGEGSVSGEQVAYTVASADSDDDGSMDDRQPKGTPTLRWNLSNAAGDPHVENTANCYVIDSPGYYSLPLVYGNAIKNGSHNTAAYKGSVSGGGSYYMRNSPRHDGNAISDAHIYDNFPGQPFGARLVWEERPGFITDVAIDPTGEHLVFNVPSGGSTMGLGCNAIVAVTNQNGVIVWSWHIWATPLDMNSFHTVAGGWQFAKYNLGWVPPVVSNFYPKRTQQVRIRQTDDGGEEKVFTITSNGQSGESTEGRGTFYQFGRKDPFPATDIAGFSKTGQSTGGTLAFSIQNPDKFMSVPSESYDWNSVDYDNTWNINQGISQTPIKSVYDPSPVGLMVPPLGAFPVPTSYNFQSGYWFDTAAGPNTAFFPVTNRRTNTFGNLDNWPGGYGGLWSSTGNTHYEDRPIGGTGQYTREWYRQAGALVYNNLVTNADKGYRARAYGYGIRPIKEK